MQSQYFPDQFFDQLEVLLGQNLQLVYTKAHQLCVEQLFGAHQGSQMHINAQNAHMYTTKHLYAHVLR